MTVLLGLLAALVATGCGVSPQDRPVAVSGSSPSPQSSATPQVDGFFVTVYFVRHGQLVPVTRPAPDTLTATALEVLAAGPDQVEATEGVETAIVPQPLAADTDRGDVVVVEATRDLTSITGDNQLLATAQLVWTVTGNAPGDRVQFAVDGQPIEVPTDHGLTRRPVGRSDYLSVAPAMGPALSPSPTPTPS